MKRTKILMAVLTLGFVLPTTVVAEDGATVKGKVLFTGDRSEHRRVRLNTNKDPNCAKSKPAIGSYDVIINKTDPLTLRNVMVWVEEGLGDQTFEAPSEPAVLNQFGCEYDPHVFGIMEGQTLVVKNSDDTNHNIHFLPDKNEEINFTQPKKGMTKELTLKAEDVFKIKCDVHPWMGAYVKIFTHPFFSVTDEQGKFEIKGLPPGKYTFKAWHETFGTKEFTAEVASGESKEVEVSYDGKEKP